MYDKIVRYRLTEYPRECFDPAAAASRYDRSRMTPPNEAQAKLTALLAQALPEEGPYQELLETHTELVPRAHLINGVQWNCVISKFQVGINKTADLAYVTKNTARWRAVLIELEHPEKRLFVGERNLDFHSDTRKAIAQVESWRTSVAVDRNAVRNQLRPLVHMGGMFDTNPIDFKYVLVIGRNTHGGYSQEQAHRIARLEAESEIELLTWDSIFRGCGLASDRLNVLSHWNGGFRIKSAQSDTGMFAKFHANQIQVDATAEEYFVKKGYNIPAWRSGKLLGVSDREPMDSVDNALDAAFSTTGSDPSE